MPTNLHGAPTDAATPDDDAAANEGSELVMFLERDQLSADTSIPVARARLGRRTRLALWGLRIFVLIIGAMVIYTFAEQLG